MKRQYFTAGTHRILMVDLYYTKDRQLKYKYRLEDGRELIEADEQIINDELSPIRFVLKQKDIEL